MKKITWALITALVLVGIAHASAHSRLTIRIKGVKDSDGYILISIWGNRDKFLDTQESMLSFKQKAIKGDMEFTSNELVSRNYAIGVIHDKNDNEDMDLNLFGHPAESYGFSNDAIGIMGPPSYEQSQFTVTQNTEIEINMK